MTRAALAFVIVILISLCAYKPAQASWLVMRARSDIGKSARELHLHRLTLWCSAYLDYLTGRNIGDRARDWAKRPRVAPCTPGAIVVLARGKNGGHVGVGAGCDDKGNAIVISGNHNSKVGEGVYARARVIAWVAP